MVDKLLNVADTAIGRVLQDFGNEMQERLRQNLNSKGASDTGDLEQSINFTAEIFGSKFI